MGLALNLEEDSVGVVLIGDDTKISEGDSSSRPDELSKSWSAWRCWVGS